ncbi:regulator of G-protein signaling 6 isoform X1 [Etheostoma cragini]|uniref:regulator of G-protein signaling 6 isoform X1 n=1 Tax=Etheostoma cragini TaxID=417921 RepID=UPI00155F3BAC|nr:regulator of G-protein signaling 6 isoform X1 [Etheostoma cragini]XP_034756412.1 regulator of G-protein signaling 6 isoform X1 [Etheostoma cragini]XP_034756413.1 regulator of G-protein signaling 6 isoform X1 [Etheostoma cragini]
MEPVVMAEATQQQQVEQEKQQVEQEKQQVEQEEQVEQEKQQVEQEKQQEEQEEQEEQEQQEQQPSAVEVTETDEGTEEPKESVQTTPTRPMLSMRSMSTVDPDDDSPNMIVYRKIEDIITRIQDETEGVPIRTVKSFMTKIPSVVTGTDIVQWLMKNLFIEDPAEAMHIGSLIAAQGYFFPISDHVLSLKDDGTFYRFQAPYFWPSNCWEPENTDYAIYLCKRTMQNKTRLELADYEAENLARLQRAFARKWEFIYMQAEAQVKIDRKKDKTERKILDSQERAFWDVHRPVPGCVNTTEMDIRKCRRMKNPHRVKKSVYGLVEEGTKSRSPVHTPSHLCRKGTKEDVEKEILFLNTQLDRHCMKMSKVAESLISYTEQYMDYDQFVTAQEPSNPWTSDDPSLWELEASKEPSQQRMKKWGFSLDEALKDPSGQELFLKFLESEFSSENLRFWLAVQDLKRMPQQDVAQRAQDIWAEFLAEGAPSSINLDSHSYERTSQNLKDPGRYSYEDAQDHIYKLMKSDSYTRFLRSNVYQDLLMARKKPETEQGRRTSLEKFTRSVGKSLTGKRLTGLMQSS